MQVHSVFPFLEETLCTHTVVFVRGVFVPFCLTKRSPIFPVHADSKVDFYSVFSFLLCDVCFLTSFSYNHPLYREGREKGCFCFEFF